MNKQSHLSSSIKAPLFFSRILMALESLASWETLNYVISFLDLESIWE